MWAPYRYPIPADNLPMHLLVHWQIICRDRIFLRLYHRAGLCRLGPPGQARTNHYGITPIATLERFVVYCSCEQNISAAPPGAAQRARGIAQAVTDRTLRELSESTALPCTDPGPGPEYGLPWPPAWPASAAARGCRFPSQADLPAGRRRAARAGRQPGPPLEPDGTTGSPGPGSLAVTGKFTVVVSGGHWRA